MKFTLSWLLEYLDTKASVAELSVALTRLGLEVEGIENPAEKLAGFVTAEIVSFEKHPNADRLNVCRISTGSETLQVVCGAPNVRQGLKGIFAPVGASIPRDGFVLKKAKIRDVESNGMMCSASELLLDDEADGIIDLPANTNIGVPAAEALGLNDPVFEISITPNRGDCLGVMGIARDLAAAGIGTFKAPQIPTIEAQEEAPVTVTITKDAEKACPLFALRLIRNVKNGESPLWLQQKLKAIGLRPISALVDITNYFSFARGRPLHVFDADKIKGKKLTIALSKGGEEFAGLDEKTYKLLPGMITICDESGVISLAGVMGGESTGCDENTKNVLVEAAAFDPIFIAEAGRKLQILSDARYRFERGVDPDSVMPGLDAASQMVVELCGGTPAKSFTAGSVPAETRKITYSPEAFEKRMGYEVDEKTQEEILENLGMMIEVTGSHWLVVPPKWRPDITITEDLIEEIARIDGYDRIPDHLPFPDDLITTAILSPLQRRVKTAQRVLAASGLQEAVTWSFTSENHAQIFGHDDLRLDNPISSDLNVMRPSLLPNLCLATAYNLDRGAKAAMLFEVGPSFSAVKPGAEQQMASGILSGQVPTAWNETPRHFDLYDAKAVVESTLTSLGLDVSSLRLTPEKIDAYHPERVGVYRRGKEIVAIFGELHPLTQQHFGMKTRLYAFEIFLEAWDATDKKKTKKSLLERSPYPAVERDFAFIMDEKILYGDLQKAIHKAHDLVQAVNLFDLYQGEKLPKGQKSLALRVTLQSMKETLTEDVIVGASKAILTAAEKMGASLRKD